MAEVELRVLSRPCLDRRLAKLDTMQHEMKAWEQKRKARQTGIDWRFTTHDARIRLQRLYPQYQA